MANWVRVGAVVLLVLLAGCFGGSPDATPSGTSIQQSPTDSPSPTVGVTAPGVDSTLDNVTALMYTHNRSLYASGFVLEVSSGDRTLSYRVASDGSTRSIEASDGSIELWGNESVRVLRRATDDGVVYEPAGNELSPDRMTRLSRLEALLTTAAFARTGTTDCGSGTCVSLHANSSTNQRYANFTADLEVDTDGVVRSLSAEYETADQEGSEPSVYRYEVVQLGDVAPTEPDWIGAALAEIDS